MHVKSRIHIPKGRVARDLGHVRKRSLARRFSKVGLTSYNIYVCICHGFQEE